MSPSFCLQRLRSFVTQLCFGPPPRQAKRQAHTFEQTISLENRTLLSVEPVLVKDFGTSEVPLGNDRYDTPTEFVQFNGLTYFANLNAETGVELWRTDGTPEGTLLFKNIAAGIASSSPKSFTVSGGLLYFTANDGVNGRELWKSDGTVGGTVMVANIAPGVASSNPANLTTVNGVLFFTANDGVSGDEIWKSNGTSAGTVLVQDISLGGSSSYPKSLTSFNNRLAFSTLTTAGRELWISDGTSAGTMLVRDVTPGNIGDGPQNLLAIGSTLYFVQNDGTNGSELWKSNGTSAGTVMVRNIATAAGAGSYPENLTAVGSTLYFSAVSPSTGRELWKSNGTTSGTVLVKDITPGTAWSYLANFVNNNGTLFFGNQNGLWKSDGTSTGTVLVSSVAPYATASPLDSPRIQAIAGTVYFVGPNAYSDRELWKSDGTSSGTIKVVDLSTEFAGSYPQSLTAIGSSLLFTAKGTSGVQLFKTDGTSTGTVSLQSVRLSTAGSPYFLTSNDGGTFVQVKSSTGLGADLLRVVGASTEPFARILSPNAISTLEVAKSGSNYFLSVINGTSKELWKTDGTEAGTSLLKSFPGGQYSWGIKSLTDLNGTLYFSADDGVAGAELWKSDGTISGTAIVKDIYPGTTTSWNGYSNVTVNNSSGPSSLTVVGGTLFFLANDGVSGQELWKSNGTSSGTVLVKDIFPGASSSFPTSLTASGGLLYFIQYTAATGTELWKSDGTEAGTNLISDINPGADTSDPQFLTDLNGTLVFTAKTAINGRELWRTDGTPAGTSIIRDLSIGTLGNFLNDSFFKKLIVVNGKTYFVGAANNGGNGSYGLWRTDGTATGTELVAIIPTGQPGETVENFTAVGNVFYFVTAGGNLLTSDGTSNAIRPITGLPRLTSFLQSSGNTLYVRYESSVFGSEPWAILNAGNGITGKLFSDINANGVEDLGESGVAGVQVLLDRNNNGLLDGPSSVTQTFSSSAVTPIVDQATVTSTISVSGPRTATTKVSVRLNISHARTSDLVVSLISPQGTRVQLANRAGAGGSNFTGTLFDDSATTAIAAATAPFTGSFRPSSVLSNLVGGRSEGVWTLEVIDTVAGTTGTIDSWSLDLSSNVAAEELVTTKSDGSYQFLSLLPENYQVVPLLPTGWVQTSPSGNSSIPVNLIAGGSASGRNFGASPPPNASVFVGTELVPDNTGLVDWGTVFVNTPAVTRVLTVTNTGSNPLVLQPATITSGSGFTITSNLTAGQSLLPGASTTISVSLDTSQVIDRVAELSFASNDPDNNPYNFSLQASVVNPPEIEVRIGTAEVADNVGTANFGFAGLNDYFYRTIEVRNTGAGRLILQPATITSPSGTGFLLNSNFLTGQIVEPGTSAYLSVWMNTSTLGDVTGTLSFASNDQDENPYNFSLFGTVIIPPKLKLLDTGIEVKSSPGVAGFGTVPQGETLANRTFTVRNDGTGPLVMQPATITGSGFTIVNNFTAGQSIAPGASASLVFAVDNSTSGNKDAKLSIFSNDLSYSEFTVDLSASVNSLPALTNNTGLSVQAGQTFVLSSANLLTTDNDNSPAQLLYTLTSLPVNGVLQAFISGSWTPLLVGNRFSQAEINAGLIRYVHGGGIATSDSFSFSVTDGVNMFPGTTQIPWSSAAYPDQKSADGRYVVFASAQDNLVLGDNNGLTDIFVTDTVTNQTVSASFVGGNLGNGQATEPSMSADGRFIVFNSYASNLVPGDTNNSADVFLFDRVNGTLIRVSNGVGGVVGNAESNNAVISADGRFVVFSSAASNLVAADTNAFNDIFLFDRQSGQVTQVTTGVSGTQANGWSFGPSISGNGRFISFSSAASNLINNDQNGADDVFVFDRQTGLASLVSANATGEQGNQSSYTARSAISLDGRFITYSSPASNLAPNDVNGWWDAFVFDRQTGSTSIASVGNTGQPANDATFGSFISPDGRFVTMFSYASNFVPGGEPYTYVPFVRDRGVVQSINASVTATIIQPPEIDVRDQYFGAPTTIPDGTGTMVWGNVPQGSAVGVRTLAVHNTGPGNLVLQPATITAGSGFTIVNNFTPGQVIAPGGVAWITLALDSTTAGPKAATLSLPNNDLDENPYDFSLTANVVPPPVVTIIDDGDVGYGVTGSWGAATGGFGNDRRFAAPGAGNLTATYQFSNLAPGQYRISTTWVSGTNRGSDIPYAVSSTVGGPVLQTFTVNQQLAPTGFSEGGVTFQNIGSVNLFGNSLVVRITNTTTGWVNGDAIRIERIGNPVAIVDDGDLGYGVTGSWGAATGGFGNDRRFAAPGAGNLTATYQFSNLAPGQYRISTTWVSGTNRGSDIPYAVSSTVGGPVLQTFTVNQQLAPTGFSEGGVTFQNIGSVNLFGNSLVVRITNTTTGWVNGDAIRIERLSTSAVKPSVGGVLDDGDAGFSLTGSWTPATGGVGNDQQVAAAGNGNSTATWTYTNLIPGRYRIATTWQSSPAAADNVPYTISQAVGGPALISQIVNQRFNPATFLERGTLWQSLGEVSIFTNTLSLTLANTPIGISLADAIRIERVGEAVALVDDGDAGFSVNSNSLWGSATNGYDNDRRLANPGAGNATATYQFNNLAPGVYRIATTWVPGSNRGNNIPYAVSSTVGGAVLQTFNVNQQIAPTGFVEGGVTFQNIGTINTFGNSLVVTIANTTSGNVNIDAIRLERIGNPTAIVDDGDTGFSVTGTWSTATSGYGNGRRLAATGSGNATATWSFSGLAAGQYRVFATWNNPGTNRTAAAPFAVAETTAGLAAPLLSTTVNQQSNPVGITDGGSIFQSLGTVTIVGNTLVVRLSNSLGGLTTADAIRIERIG